MYNQGNAVAAANATIGGAPKAQSETQYAAQVLDSALARLEARVAELSQRLAPVIEERPQANGNVDGKAERQMFSALGRGIIETSYRVEGIERRINGLLDTLAI